MSSSNNDNLRKIKKVTISRHVCLLKKPYILSFATLSEFISIRVRITLLNNIEREAEVVPLQGYSDESESDILEYLEAKVHKIIGYDLADARSLVEEDIKRSPFCVTAILTAIDLFEYKFDPNSASNKFVIPASTSKPEELFLISDKLNKSKGTIKIKLTGDVGIDCAALESLNMRNQWFDLQIRLDANQAYQVQDADIFFECINKLDVLKKISYIEQPLNVNDWDGHSILRIKYPDIDIMLDESIVMAEDIYKAKSININYVKLKLFKQGGIKELLRLSEIACKAGLRVVLGNGVATWMSNRIEIGISHLYPEYFFGLLEANGFEKVSDKISAKILLEVE